MAGERQWVETVKRDLGSALGRKVIVQTAWRLPYAVHVSGYRNRASSPGLADPLFGETQPYQTDLMIAEPLPNGTDWIPRVVVEFKLGKVSTHDALTYSAKAATHKNVHPYLRYGIVIGGYDARLPRRLVRHGQAFDFMATLASETLTDADRKSLVRLLRDELNASRCISAVLSGSSDARLFHRRLITA